MYEFSEYWLKLAKNRSFTEQKQNYSAYKKDQILMAQSRFFLLTE